MEKVKKEQLTGYRRPTESERSSIQRYLLPELYRKQRKMRRLTAFLGCVTGIFCISILMKLWEKDCHTGELGVMIVLTLLMLWGLLSVGKSRTKKRLLTAGIREGDFDVLDCISDRFDTDVETVGKGVVLIGDRNGHHCTDYFLIDYETAREYRGENHIPMLLMREKEMEYYVLFSSRMMNGG